MVQETSQETRPESMVLHLLGDMPTHEREASLLFSDDGGMILHGCGDVEWIGPNLREESN